MSKKKELDEGVIMKALNFAYDKALTPVVGLDSAYDLANDYLKKKGTSYDQVNSLIRWQNAKASTSGFITNIGGLLMLPIGLPANITSALYIQIRMVAAIAIIGGFDPKDEIVKSLILSCLVASSANEIAKQLGIKLGEKMAIAAIRIIPMEIIKKLNQMVIFKLLARFGYKGLTNAGRLVPFFGGFIGAVFDCVSTNKIGNVARDMFIPKE